MYVGKPKAQDWRDGLRDFWDVAAGKRARKVWVVDPWTYRKNDYLVTYMQTRPAMVVFLDQFYRGSRGSDGIYSDTVAHFKHGIPLGIIADNTGIDLTKVDGYLEQADAQAVIDALKHEYTNDTGLFGDNRMSDLI
jgi:hypothetical protein